MARSTRPLAPGSTRMLLSPWGATPITAMLVEASLRRSTPWVSTPALLRFSSSLSPKLSWPRQPSMAARPPSRPMA